MYNHPRACITVTSLKKYLTQALAVGLAIGRMPESMIQRLHHHVSAYGPHFEKPFVKLCCSSFWGWLTQAENLRKFRCRFVENSVEVSCRFEARTLPIPRRCGAPGRHRNQQETMARHMRNLFFN